MEKLTPQIAAMYLGCRFRYTYEDETHERELDGLDLVVLTEDYTDVRLCLRPLSSMTEEEAREFLGIKNVALRLDIYRKAKDIPDMLLFTPNEIVWLLSKSFDLFGLLESGLAVPQGTNQQQP